MAFLGSCFCLRGSSCWWHDYGFVPLIFVFYSLVCWPGLFLLLGSRFFLGFSCYWWCDKDFPLVALDWLQSWVFLAFWVVHIIRLFPDFWVVHIIRFWVFLIALLFNCCLSWLLRSKSLRGPPVFKITQFFWASKECVLGQPKSFVEAVSKTKPGSCHLVLAFHTKKEPMFLSKLTRKLCNQD